MKRRTRMYEPWGYQDQNDYQGVGIILENDLDSFFAEVSYNKDDNKIHFANKDGEEKATLDVNEFVKSQVIVERAWYEDGNIHVKFTNGDEIVVDVKELLDENEFKDGLQVVEGQVSVLINTAESDEYISVGEAGIKLFGVKRDIDAEQARAEAAEQALDEKIDAEIERATSAEETLDEKIDAEIARATAEETRIDTKLDQEIARATAEEAAANRRIDSLNDELDAEKTIREAADAALGRRIDQEIDDRTADVDEEETRAKAAETALDTKIDAEIERATNAETQLQGDIEAEGQRAQDAETALDGKIDTEIAERKAEAVATAEYVKNDNKIYFKNANDETISEVDTTDFVVDGMIEDVKIENGNLVITFNTDAGKQDITIPLTQIFDPSNYYTKTEVDENIADEATARENGDTALDEKIAALEEVAATKAALEAEEERAVRIETSIIDIVNTHAGNDDIHVTTQDKETWNNKIDATALDDYATKAEVEAETARATAEEAKKVEKTIQGSNGKALIFNESDGGGAKFEHNDGTWSFAGVNDGGENGIAGQIYALKKNAEDKMEGTRIDVTKNAMYYTVGAEVAADRMVAANEIAVKGDIPTNFYSQEEVDALIKAKETEIYNLTKLVGEIGGNVTYTYPNELGTSLTSLLGNYGTVKLSEDATISRFGPGVTAKNKVTLNLNNHNLTSTSAGSYGAIMARGTQEITIGGKGTIEAGDGICIEANGSTAAVSPTINLTGSTTVYHTNRPGGELIYCYVGTINISNGTFRNDGASNYTLNCYDANYQNGTAKIIVTGGKFYDFNPADNSAEGEHTSFVPEGYHVETSTVTEEGVEHTIYTVKKDA